MMPKNVYECFIELIKMLDPNKVDDFMMWSEDDISKAHHGLGQWIRNNWGLWQGGDLKDHMMGLGFTHPDDMSHTILLAFHRHLHGLPLGLEKEVAKYKEYWDKNGH
jgi:hypothetical protein